MVGWGVTLVGWSEPRARLAVLAPFARDSASVTRMLTHILQGAVICLP